MQTKTARGDVPQAISFSFLLPFVFARAYRYKNRTAGISPNMLIKKIRSVLPVAGPGAESTNSTLTTRIGIPIRRAAFFFLCVSLMQPLL